MVRRLKMAEIKTIDEQIQWKECTRKRVSNEFLHQRNLKYSKIFTFSFSSVPCIAVHVHWCMWSQKEIPHQSMPYCFKISLKLDRMKHKIHRSLKPWLSVILQHLVPLWALELSSSLRWPLSCNLLEEWVSPLPLKRRKPALKTEKGGEKKGLYRV